MRNLDFNSKPFVLGKKSREIASLCGPGGNTAPFGEIEKKASTVSGKTVLLEDVLPKERQIQ